MISCGGGGGGGAKGGGICMLKKARITENSP